MIIIKRCKGAGDKLRAYKILLDGTEIGKIRQGESKQFPAQEGKHSLQLKIDWCTSEPVTFDLADKSINFECGSQNLIGGLVTSFFWTKDHVWLRRVE